MARCSAIKADGTRCQRSADGPHGLCWSHAPENAAARRAMASRAARSRPSKELAEIKSEIKAVIAAVDSGETERGVGSVLGQLYNVLLRAVEVERKVAEADEHLRRIEDLERRMGGRGFAS